MSTIDVLILETLEPGRSTTAQELSRMWGEDRTRVYEWLEKFTKLGLCSRKVVKARGRKPGHIAYVGRIGKITEYLATRRNGFAK